MLSRCVTIPESNLAGTLDSKEALRVGSVVLRVPVAVLLDKREILLGKEKARASGSEQAEGRDDKIQTKFPWRIHADPKAQ